MNHLRFLSRLALGSLLIFAFGCGNTDTSLSSGNNTTLDESALAKQSTVSYEYSSMDAADENPEFKDAIFSIGWSTYYNPFDQTVADRSDAFAIAPDTSADNQQFRRHLGGKDMGTVTLAYGSDSIELFRVEMRNGGVFYNYGKRRPGNPRGMFHGDNGEVGEAIPFVAGQTYRFDASGSADFPAMSAEIAASAQALQVTAPAAGTQIDGSDLAVTWDGGATGGKIVVGLVPVMDRGTFERDHNGGQGGHGGPNGGNGGRMGGGHGGPMGGPMGGMVHGFGDRFSGPSTNHDMEMDGPGQNAHLHWMYVLDENSGSFTVPADDVQALLGMPGVKGALVQVRQMVTTDFDIAGRKVAIQLRAGDAVQVDIAQ